MKNPLPNILLPLMAVAATAVPTDPARACAEAVAALPVKAVKSAPAKNASPASSAVADFCLRRLALRAF